jgi:hypothetical protein
MHNYSFVNFIMVMAMETKILAVVFTAFAWIDLEEYAFA